MILWSYGSNVLQGHQPFVSEEKYEAAEDESADDSSDDEGPLESILYAEN